MRDEKEERKKHVCTRACVCVHRVWEEPVLPVPCGAERGTGGGGLSSHLTHGGPGHSTQVYTIHVKMSEIQPGLEPGSW